MPTQTSSSLPPEAERKLTEFPASLPTISDPGVSSGTSGFDPAYLAPALTLPSRTSQKNHPYLASQASDPRSSSTQSLRPVESAGQNRRTLLLVYIHGFLGNETSFQSFPAHVHNLLTMTLAESHIVYTKIYPRYKSRRHISFARDDFSNWLYPHESPSTDIVILGHSLGGILAAEVVLLQSHIPNSHERFQHRILGMIAFDTPFLGIHPGVVTTGIASLFKSPPTPPESTSQAQHSAGLPLLQGPASPDSDGPDPFSSSLLNNSKYNPSYNNDVHLPERKTKLERAWYFWNKHCGELSKAAQSYVTSHFEFGGCLADYPGLRRRYDAVRALEDVDDRSDCKDSQGRLLRRVRFVNYYSVSTGRIKQHEPTAESGSAAPDALLSPSETLQAIELRRGSTESISRSPSPPAVSRPSLDEEHAQLAALRRSSGPDQADVQQSDSLVKPDDLHGTQNASVTLLTKGSMEEAGPKKGSATMSVQSRIEEQLPPILPLPSVPAQFDSALYTDADTLKVAQKEHQRNLKAYERAKKDREKSVRDRERLVQKRLKAVRKEEEKASRVQQYEQEQSKLQKQQSTISQSSNLSRYDNENEIDRDGHQRPQASLQASKEPRDRKFCSLPSRDIRTGMRDPAWVRVYMEGMDEVVAHTSMFCVGETYAKLVGDTTGRIEDWIHEDRTKRAILADLES